MHVPHLMPTHQCQDNLNASLQHISMGNGSKGASYLSDVHTVCVSKLAARRRDLVRRR